MRVPKILPLVAAFLTIPAALTLSAIAEPTTQWHVVKTIPIGGVGGMDYLTVDPASHLLYVPRSTHTQVIDPASGKVVADIAGQKNAHGVALAPKSGRGFISDGGGTGSITIFDLKSNQTLGTLTTVPDTDGIAYDAFTGLILSVAGDSGVLLTINPDIDPKNGKIETPIQLGGAPEFFASDGAGKVFINLEDKNEVVAVDLKARKVIARWPVAPGGAPVGMSIDRAKHQIFIGCRKPQKMIVMSTVDGKVLADLPIGMGVDATVTHQGQSLASCGDGTLAIVAETAPGKFTTVQSLKTFPGAKTMGLDPSTETLYMPTAEFGPPKPGASRGAAIPGSFKIVVVAPDTK